ncbi:hypothetical protein GR160_18525 [Flavobacterium sp. Sd200]|uniref:DUF6364 family protein n=1 Tax=Flavobacterium sp. Sd200 TaxID=2692211 RepID=UPI00136814EA|nr:DUF6364 family protein [Flavobacterium sp. Sd200]MXN93229.1 hypothetical protein [Flavobacterium sp. Sd200]
MKARLTLTLDEELIAKAKDYANKSGRSLSEIVENYLKAILILDKNKDLGKIEISPFVKSLSIGSGLSADLDYKKEYTDYLIEKYK